jgi:hypothetical protein
MFKNIPAITNNLMADNDVKTKYSKLQSNDTVAQKDIDDLCPICLDDLENGEAIDFCKYSCGKSVHVDCFAMWTKSKGDTCVYCRYNWNIIPKSTNNNTSHGYLNLLK